MMIRRRPVWALLLLAALVAAVLLVPPAGTADAQTPRAVECVPARANADGSFTVPRDWALAPAGVPEGASFRLLFVTSNTRDATSSDIGTYNSFVQSTARAGHAGLSDSCADLFRVVGSTAAVGARDNTATRGSDPGASIWWLGGAQVADDYADFYDGSWDSRSSTNESGSTNTNQYAHTGTDRYGSSWSNAAFGDPNVIRASVWGGSAHNVLEWSPGVATDSRAFYGLSPVFVKAPSVYVQFRTCAGTVSATSSALVANLGQAARSSGIVMSTGGGALAQEFTTGARPAGHTLTSVDIGFRSIHDAAVFNGNPGLVVTIRGVSGIDPGATLATLTRPTLANSSSAQTYTFTHAGFQLQPDTTYWLVVQFPGLNNAGSQISSTDSNNEDGGGASGWSIGNTPLLRSTTTWVVSAQGNMQFRVNGWATAAGDTCSTGWVTTDETDPPPTITLTEGGAPVTYQWRVQDDRDRTFNWVVDEVTRSDSKSGGRMDGSGGPDRDRLICHTGVDLTGKVNSHWSIGALITDEALKLDGEANTVLKKSGGHAGVNRDRHNGCPFAPQYIYSHEGTTAWRPVTIAAGHDSDAFDHTTHLIHKPAIIGGEIAPLAPVALPPVRVRVNMEDDDSWQNDIVIAADNNGSPASTWTSINDAAGWNQAFPAELPRVALADSFVCTPTTSDTSTDGVTEGNWPWPTSSDPSHTFWVRLANDPATLPAGAPTSVLFFMRAEDDHSLEVGRWGAHLHHKVLLKTNAAVTTLPDSTPATGGSINVTYTPAKVDIYVGHCIEDDANRTIESRSTDRSTDPWTVTSTTRTVSVSADVRFSANIFKVYRRLETDFSPHQLTKPFSISRSRTSTATDPGTDVVLEVQELVSQMSDYLLGGGSQTTLTIASDASEVTEGGDVTYTITANPAPAEDVTFEVAIKEKMGSGGDAIGSEARELLVIPSGASSITWTVTAHSDDVARADGTIVAQIIPGDGYTQGLPAAVSMTLLDDDGGSTPVVSVTGGTGITEGGSASFTVSASPAPASNLDVQVTITQSGDYGATTGQRTVTIPTTGSVSFTVATTDDQVDETDGSVTATVNAGTGYTVSSSQGAATVSVADNDGGPDYTDYQTAVDYLIQVRDNPQNTAVQGNPVHIRKWNAVLAALGYDSGVSPMAESEIHANAARWPDSPFKAASDYLKSLAGQPEISITGGTGITEGGSASFTVSASPAPSANLAVQVTITQSGDFGASTGQQTVTIPTTGSVSFTVATTDDQVDETAGSVTATVDAGSGYTVSSTQGAATVSVADNDDAPPPPPTPEISISGGSGITEGGSASFTVSASPAPSANLAVQVTVTQSGDFGATTGQRTVTIPTSGSVTVTVGTTDDSVDEAAGSVTVTVNTGSGYTVSATQGAATVSVADNDDTPPPPPPPPPTPEVSITGGSGITEGGSASFTVSASPAPSANLAVQVTVTQSGDFGATTGQQTVTIPPSGSVTLTVATTDDSVDEVDGSVTATVNAGSGYTVSASQGAATVSVSDNDDATPEVSITGGTDITEGGDASFTVSASPAPAANLDVSVTITQSGDFGASTGQQTVTIPPSGSVPLTVGTTDDDADEADGSVTATLDTPAADAGYTVSATQGAATVTVADNDDTPQLGVLNESLRLTVADAAAVEGDPLEFVISLNRAADAPLEVIYFTYAGSAGSADFVLGNDLATLAAGETELTVEIATKTDDLREGAEQMRFEVVLLPGALEVEAEKEDREASGTIHDPGTILESAVRQALAPPPPPPPLRGALETPAADVPQNGLGIVTGWVCSDAAVTIEIVPASGTAVSLAAARLPRADLPACGTSGTAFSLPVNWNQFGDGLHTVRVRVGDRRLTAHTVPVTTLGATMRSGLSGRYALPDFPQPGDTTDVVWSAAEQRFMLASGTAPQVASDQRGEAGVVWLDTPVPGSFQSGPGVLTGWVCEAETVEVVLTPAGGASVRLPVAYGTARADTLDLCGDTTNGFGRLLNWPALGAGVHTVEVLVDGESVAQSTVRVTTLAAERRATYTLEGFPTATERVTLEWQAATQSFVITAHR